VAIGAGAGKEDLLRLLEQRINRNRDKFTKSKGVCGLEWKEMHVQAPQEFIQMKRIKCLQFS
jgi:hypothetical protein